MHQFADEDVGFTWVNEICHEVATDNCHKKHKALKISASWWCFVFAVIPLEQGDQYQSVSYSLHLTQIK